MVTPCLSIDTAISDSRCREPAPTSQYTHVSIGDVGFIRGGRFHLLFSAGSPLGERERGVDVPSTFEQLTVGTPESNQPRRPGCVGTHMLDTSETTVLCVRSLKPFFTILKGVTSGPWNMTKISHSSSPGIVERHWSRGIQHTKKILNSLPRLKNTLYAITSLGLSSPVTNSMERACDLFSYPVLM